MKETEKAYIAGVIDSDRCLTIVKNNYDYKGETKTTLKMSISISNCDVRMLDWIISKTNMHLYKGKHVDKRSDTFRPQYRLMILRLEEGKEFLESIFKYLVIKKRQAKILLLFINKRLEKRSKIKNYEWELMKEIHYLNRKGPR